MPAADELVLALRMAGSVLVTETQQETRLAVAAGSGTERVAFGAVRDTCPLCLALDGKVFLANSDAAKRYTPPRTSTATASGPASATTRSARSTGSFPAMKPT